MIDSYYCHRSEVAYKRIQTHTHRSATSY